MAAARVTGWGLALVAAAGIVVSGASAGCAPSDEPKATAEEDIVGGVSAKSARLDAIGALGRIQPDGSFKYYCTATLVAPRLLVTAKHCVARKGEKPYTETETIHFGIGENSKAPRRTVKVERTWMASLDEGGYIKRGADVAMMSLAEPVDDIAPLPLANDHVSADNVGARVSAVGYGVRSVRRESGIRRAGTLTIRTVEGPLLGSVFQSEEDLVSFVRTEGGAAYSEARDETRARELYAYSMLEHHELFAGIAPGDAQPCSGDSGGPLVARVDGGLAVFAVVSGSFKLTNSDANPCSVVGEVYATFPSDIQAMFDEAAAATDGPPPARVPPTGILAGAPVAVPTPSAGDADDRCAGLSAAGRCESGVALRCIDSSEGPPHVTRTDCTLLQQTCRIVKAPAPATAGSTSGDGGGDAGAEAGASEVIVATAECVDP